MIHNFSCNNVMLLAFGIQIFIFLFIGFTLSIQTPYFLTTLVLKTLNITKTRLFKNIENFTSKNWTVWDKKKNSDIFHISAQNIDCGYWLELPLWGSSNEYPQSMVLSRNKKNNVYPCKPQFYYIKVGFMGVKIILTCFRDDLNKSIWLPVDVF